MDQIYTIPWIQATETHLLGLSFCFHSSHLVFRFYSSSTSPGQGGNASKSLLRMCEIFGWVRQAAASWNGVKFPLKEELGHVIPSSFLFLLKEQHLIVIHWQLLASRSDLIVIPQSRSSGKVWGMLKLAVNPWFTISFIHWFEFIEWRDDYCDWLTDFYEGEGNILLRMWWI